MITILLICLTIILLNPTDIIKSVTFSFSICINNLFPTLFPFLITSNLLAHYGFIEICSKKLKWLMNKIFKVNESGSYVLVMSMLSGSPSNSKYINQLLEKKLINENDANQLLKFTHFVNPLFIVGTIGIVFLKSKTLGIIILISHYLGNFINGIIFRKELIPINDQIKKDNNQTFMKVLITSINDTINTLMLILGVITTCLIITTIIDNIIHINPIVNGILELTQGVKYVSLSNITPFYKVLLITFFISFGGFSIHMQVMSILEGKKIRYLPYLKARLCHAITSSIIVMVLYYLLKVY